jgi:hypothetical protein
MCKVLDKSGALGNLGKMKASIYAVKGSEQWGY